jgi:hypothetical protein
MKKSSSRLQARQRVTVETAGAALPSQPLMKSRHSFARSHKRDSMQRAVPSHGLKKKVSREVR